jgi:tRNA (cmo5U34)-methyltransferase
MLERAREVVGEPAAFCVGDLRESLPCGPFDAVISALAIHHLDDRDKRDLFARVYSALEPGGVFVNAEQVAAPTDILEHRYRNWHRASSLALGATQEQWVAAEGRMRLDRCATTDEQIEWLKRAGYVDVDCLFKHYRFAVLFARRPDEG